MPAVRLLTPFLIAVFVGSPTYAANTNGKEDAKNIAKKLEENRKSVVEAEAQKRKILGSLYLVNKRMKKISSDKSRLTNDLLHVQNNVKNLANLIAALESQIERQRVHLKRRLRALYKLSGQGYLAALFSSQSAVELDETLRFLKIVTENDYQMIRSYRENVVLHQKQKERLHAQVEKLVSIEKSIERQESLLASEHKEKSKIASNLDKEKIESMNRIRDLRHKGKELSSEISVDLSDLLKPQIYEQRGQLPSPVRGVVVQDFGLMVDEVHKTQLNHKGWRYVTSANAPVGSVFEGTVIYSDFVDGYGPTVVIDHGDHYYSIYSHISRVKVKAGDTLKRGQVFAEAGPPVKDYGDGIYFELRHFSEPENPVNWISKTQVRHADLDLDSIERSRKHY